MVACPQRSGARPYGDASRRTVTPDRGRAGRRRPAAGGARAARSAAAGHAARMTAEALVPSPLFGLRTWSSVGAQGLERLAAPQRGTPWPAGGEWLTARCGDEPGHAAPASGCACGIHAWHPSAKTARAVLGRRWEIPGVVECAGAIEVHRDGLRAERARPYALLVPPSTNAARAARLAAAHACELVPVRRVTGLKLGAVGAAVAVTIAGGIALSDPPDHPVLGRGGWSQPQR